MKAWHLLENLFHGHFGVKAHVYRHIHHVWRYLRQRVADGRGQIHEHNVYAILRNRAKEQKKKMSAR